MSDNASSPWLWHRGALLALAVVVLALAGPGGAAAGTASAIKAYQTDQGLLADGQPTELLLQHMRQQGG